MAVYLIIFFSVVVTQTVLPAVHNLNNDQGFVYEYERYRITGLSDHNFWEFAMSNDMVFMSVIFQFIWLFDYCKDNGFRTMCSISRSRWKIILSNYFVMILMTPILMVIKLAVVAMITPLVHLGPTSWTFKSEFLVTYLILIAIIALYEAIFYLFYIMTESFSLLLYVFFSPFVILTSDRIIWYLPYGESIQNAMKTLFFSPMLIYAFIKQSELFDGRRWLTIPIYVALTVPLLFVTCLIAEKRDVK